ncbi:MAG TPA: TonB-dependent receptor [Steroidobacteraceae bacterium]|nr:TonB-dependent receptor [Steroidobacteraceae bacterium]
MSVKQSDQVSYSIRTAVAVALGTVAMMASAPRVLAADAAAGPTGGAATSAAPVLEEVTVTGSRIRRKDLESSSPLVTIDSAQIEQRAGLNLESYLNTLPNYNPAQTPVTTNFDVQPSAVNTVGISTISLRGLGPNRSLVLIDGHRTTPINALMVTDINTIPAAMIDRIEIITGGASTAYGADAISGVTNFILKKNIQGVIVDAQDSITQAGDGNELDVNAIMGTSVADGKGNMIMGVEYYNRQIATQRNRDFYTSAWTDPNAPQAPPTGGTGLGSNAFFIQNSGYAPGLFDSPSPAALQALWPKRTVNPVTGAGVCGVSGCILNNFYFNSNGTMWTNNGAASTGNYAGATDGTGGFALQNVYDSTMANPGTTTPPNLIQNVKWNNPLATVSEPQTRYSFFANGTYDLTDKIQIYTNARYAQSKTYTLLPTGTSGIFGWEATVPFNAATDSPIDPTQVNNATTTAQLQTIAAAFASGNPGTFANTGFKGPGAAGTQHPVPWQMALLLLSRGAANGVPGFPGATSAFTGGPVTCSPYIAASLCSQAPTSWILNYLPNYSAPQRSTLDQSDVWQIETGIKFPVFADWTGDLYYSRGESTNYENGIGNDSLQRFRAVIDSPGYGAGQNFQGNANGASTNFGTSVPSHCTSGFYNTIFSGDQAASADCMTAIAAPLQTLTAMQQDIVEANFQGTLFKLPAGDVSAAVGYQYRRDAGLFTPDNMQSTYSFLDQTIGLYPLGTLNNEIASRDGYAELFVPVVSDLPFLQKLSLDVGGRYSSFTNNIPNATTFKVNLDAQITKQLRIRGGFNRATRAPNLGELYLGEQEYFGGGAAYGDPCSVRSPASFGAGGAAKDFSTVGGDPVNGAATKLAPGQSAAGAASAYLICQAMMGNAGAAYYYGPNSNQGSNAAPAAFAWLNEGGNPTLRSETANTWTAGIVFSNLGDSPWISGLSGSLDWWQIDVQHAIELDSPDYANYLCFGTVQVSSAAGAAAQAQSAACQNVARNQVTGGGTTTLLTYTNQATIGIAGVDFQLNWFAQFADLGLKLPGGLSFNSQDTFLQYFKTKTSPTAFDVDTNWKDSLGPTLSGTNAGAYGYRLNASIGYVLPSFTFNLRWRFLPSVNSAAHATQQAIIANNNSVAGGGAGTLLGYIPNTDIATPHWQAVDMSFTWNLNKVLEFRGGINNLFNKEPAIAGAASNFPVGTNLAAVCGGAPGCQNPTQYSQPVDGAGNTMPGFYDVYGRTFFLGMKARF